MDEFKYKCHSQNLLTRAGLFLFIFITSHHKGQSNDHLFVSESSALNRIISHKQEGIIVRSGRWHWEV